MNETVEQIAMDARTLGIDCFVSDFECACGETHELIAFKDGRQVSTFLRTLGVMPYAEDEFGSRALGFTDDGWSWNANPNESLDEFGVTVTCEIAGQDLDECGARVARQADLLVRELMANKNA